MKKIAILGSTGSIGTQCLDIVEKNPSLFQATVLTCGKNIPLFCQQVEKFSPSLAITQREEDAMALSKKYPKTSFSFGEKGLIEAATFEDSHMIVNALVGMMGLLPTYHGIQSGKDIALANKETLVAGGAVIMEEVRKVNIKLLPVDSEHSAIFQCLQGNNHKELRKILLTASGGPFRGSSLEKLKAVTLAEALNHPNWSMGSKITIDSATMMNKGLEVIEAKWLFGVLAEAIEVLVHPESIIHSMVEYIDGSVIAQLGVPDMRTPISYALHYPARLNSAEPGINFSNIQRLTFEKPDMKTFRCLQFAYEAMEKGGSYPVVLNGANEVLVGKFLQGEISFLDIQNTLEQVLDEHNPTYNLTLDDIIQVDGEIRERLKK